MNGTARKIEARNTEKCATRAFERGKDQELDSEEGMGKKKRKKIIPNREENVNSGE